LSADLESLRTRIREHQPQADLGPVEAAWEVARRVHGSQVRVSGAPRTDHLLAVANLVADLRLDVPSVCAALLHEVPEESPEEAARIEERFGREIGTIVDGLGKLQRYRFTSRQETQAEHFKKMLVAMSRDVRVLLVKLCDRLHNMRDLEVLPVETRREVSEETRRIYAPLAERLGISRIRTELEDLAFRHLEPEDYQALKEAAEARLKERADFIADVQRTIRELCDGDHLAGYEVFGRPKNLYGLYRKMRVQGIPLEKVYDFVAFRVIVQAVPDCWQVLGLVHNRWTPIPSRFKDFINLPKANGYRSLHTTVFGPLEEPMEIQIRTWEMHRVAEAGIAAHWSYKEGGSVQARDQQRFNWLKQLIDFVQEVQSPQDLVEGIQGNLFTDEVFAFTPRGDLRVLPAGATALDFAYEIHTEVGHSCIGTKVNGRLVPLNTPLQSGDLVEVMTSRTSHPKRDWLNFLKTSRAQSKVRQWFQAEERARATEIGRQWLEKELKRVGGSLKRLEEEKEEERRRLFGRFHASSMEDLFRLVGIQKVPARDVVSFLFPEAVPAPPAEPEVPKDPGRLREVFRKRSSGIAVDGIEDMMLHLARCCNPIPGDDIVAFVTRGRGVTVHQRACPTARTVDPDRLLDAHWVQRSAGVFDVPVVCEVEDQPGLLAKVTREISDHQSNIASILTRDLGDRRVEIRMVLQVEDQQQLDAILRGLRRVRGVLQADRLRQAK